MKHRGMPTHPDVTYWTCPVGDAAVVYKGENLHMLAVFGQEIETADELADFVPRSQLEAMETTVERHELEHLGAAS